MAEAENRADAVAILNLFFMTYPSMDRQLSNFQWLADDDAPETIWSLWNHIHELAQIDLSSAQRILSFPWLADGINGDETRAIGSILESARKDLSLAQRIIDVPWFADGINTAESRAIAFVLDVELNADQTDVTADERLLIDVILSLEHAVGSLGEGVVTSLETMRSVSIDPRAIKHLVSQPWFQDGLTSEEQALIIVLRVFVGDELFRELVEDGQTLSETFSSSAADEVNLFIVGQPPFRTTDVLFAGMRFAIEAITDSFGSPWPKTNVIFHLVPDFFVGIAGPTAWQGTALSGWNFGTHVVGSEVQNARSLYWLLLELLLDARNRHP